jgi:primosomal protein N' (replication factor Y)
LDEIKTGFSQFATVLFRGITGSGKTAIYIKLIEEQLKQGKQVLFLVPEIALTTQLLGRIRQVFGEVGVYHSKMNEQERVELFNAVVQNQFQLVLGVRSGVFLPFSKLGLIIVDEEHDTAYKQAEPSPRFHARDSALVLAQLQNAQVLLGSATPSVESYFAAQSGKIGLVELDERFGEAVPPAIELIDMAKAKEQGAIKDYFSFALLSEIQEKVENNDQVILFRNRRGYHPVQQCSTCGKLVECPNCDVSLNYHKGSQNLVCHYCGHQEKSVSSCKSCGSEDISMLGFGTEKVEEDVQALFPDYKVERLDQDVTKKKSAFIDIFKAMEEGEIDILVGTQMISKGLDFENVTLVGVLNADQSLSWSDFRAVERTFQQLMQVSGRAGRHLKKGKVLIQTRQPQHPMFSFLKKQDYPSFFHWQIKERKEFGYPPFSKMMVITLSGKKEDIVEEAAQLMAKKLRISLPKGTLGPVPPPVSKINNRYYRQIQVKYQVEKIKPQTIKAHLHDLQKALQGAPIFKSIFISIDVDPA